MLDASPVRVGRIQSFLNDMSPRAQAAGRQNAARTPVTLTAEDVSAIDGAMADIEVQGARYTEAMERISGVKDRNANPA